MTKHHLGPKKATLGIVGGFGGYSVGFPGRERVKESTPNRESVFLQNACRFSGVKDVKHFP